MQELTKEFAKKLMETEGEARGVNLKTDWEVVLSKYGQEGLKKLEAKMAEMGYPIKYNEIETMNFYPAGLDALSVLSIKEVFDLNDQELKELGAAAVKFSLFLKILIRYFPSLNLLAKEAPKMWRKHYSIGDLEIVETNEEERRAVLRIKNFGFHPAQCANLQGYFSKILQMAVKAPTTCEETKCTFRGDAYHEFVIKW